MVMPRREVFPFPNAASESYPSQAVGRHVNREPTIVTTSNFYKDELLLGIVVTMMDGYLHPSNTDSLSPFH